MYQHKTFYWGNCFLVVLPNKQITVLFIQFDVKSIRKLCLSVKIICRNLQRPIWFSFWAQVPKIIQVTEVAWCPDQVIDVNSLRFQMKKDILQFWWLNRAPILTLVIYSGCRSNHVSDLAHAQYVEPLQLSAGGGKKLYKKPLNLWFFKMLSFWMAFPLLTHEGLRTWKWTITHLKVSLQGGKTFKTAK